MSAQCTCNRGFQATAATPYGPIGYKLTQPRCVANHMRWPTWHIASEHPNSPGLLGLQAAVATLRRQSSEAPPRTSGAQWPNCGHQDFDRLQRGGALTQEVTLRILSPIGCRLV